RQGEDAVQPASGGVPRQRRVRDAESRVRQRLDRRAAGDDGNAHRDPARRRGHHRHLLRPRSRSHAAVRVKKPVRSRKLFEQARQILPGGVDSPVRAFQSVGGIPLFIKRATGATIEDVDGNRSIDYVMSWGPLIHGHAPSGLVRAIAKAARLGTSFGAPSPLEHQLGEQVRALVPSMERVRFVSSGTEAAMSVARLARAFTGRDKIVKFAGCYHGHADSFLVKAGSGATTLGVPTSPGVARAVADTLLARYNDLAAVEA